jgi:Fe-S-cluster containining protein
MIIGHPSFNIEIDTDDLSVVKLFADLKNIYKNIPSTKCVNCPMKNSVTAECCKTFSPPMLLIEYINILRLYKDLFNTKEDKIKLFNHCLESYLKPDYIKPCIFLINNRCSCYEARPFSCRMFGLYSQNEWNDRLHNISAVLDIEKKDVPFNKQCTGIKVTGKKSKISKEESDKLFKDIHVLDIKLFPDMLKGAEIVTASMTYMPFDAHYLSMLMGDENLETLATMKLYLRDKLNKFNSGEIGEEEYKNTENAIKGFIETLKNSISKGIEQSG